MATTSEKTFRSICTKEGSGWPALRIVVSDFIIPDSLSNKHNVVCLSTELINPQEFDETVDALIDQLKKLKSEARPKFKNFPKIS